MLKPSELKDFIGLAVSFWNDGLNVVNNLGKDAKLIEILGAKGAKEFAVECAYELQSGSYTRAEHKNEDVRLHIADSIKRVIDLHSLENYTIADLGTGEGSTFIPLLRGLKYNEAVGLDISLSRLTWAESKVQELNRKPAFVVGALNALPFFDKSVDLSITVHALEPNGGEELPILQEINRVTRKLVILIEPDFPMGSPDQRERMRELGYIEDLRPHFEKAGLELIDVFPLEKNSNPLNIASVFTLRPSGSETDSHGTGIQLMCPLTRNSILRKKTHLEAVGSHYAYPIVRGIGMLRPKDAIPFLAPIIEQ